ncbi:Uncharacterised protein [Mycobacteroides abscessus subsp. massiliense]|nr:Uncharacterised protein [Mycobacteroides abscessus subsp. abscessus]SKQ82847.1 Uncharacterised protein [Mycobacteroides abscessus subsp. massiliense]SLC50250.1 Uncharacterised protein [Mycobacteroides abscessus subsp. massiliense]
MVSLGMFNLTRYGYLLRLGAVDHAVLSIRHIRRVLDGMAFNNPGRASR